MTEFERIELLADKLGHPLLDIRYRAAQNLLSKVSNGIISHRVLGSVNCAEALANGISKCIGNICGDLDLQSEDQRVGETLKCLLKLIKSIKHCHSRVILML
jgi:hypothetical protein